MFDIENTEKISLRSIFKKMFVFWINKYEIFFLLCLLLITAIGITWVVQNTYFYNWDDAKKREYLSSKYQQTKFQEKKFNSVLKSLEQRKIKGKQ